MRAAAVGLFERARIARPSFVRLTMNDSAINRATVTLMAITWLRVMVSAPVCSSALSVIRSGNDFGSAPKRY